MERDNLFTYNQAGSGSNTLNYGSPNYKASQFTKLTQIDNYSSQGINQEPVLNTYDKRETTNLLNQTYNVSGYLQQQAQLQPTFSQYSPINASSNSAMLLNGEKNKSRYSFKRFAPINSEASLIFKPDRTEISNGIHSKDQKTKINSISQQKQQPSNTFYSNKIKQLQTKIRQQDLLLTKIREIAYNRKNQCERNREKDYACLSTLIQIYNMTVIHTTISPLPTIKVSVLPGSRVINNIQTNYIPNPINIHIPTTPARPMIVPKPVTPVPRPPINIVISSQPIPKPEPPKVLQVVDNSEKYIKQINQLKIKILQLQSQQQTLITQIRHYQRQRYESTSSTQIISVYKQEIERLKQKILILSVPTVTPTPIYIKDEKQIEQLKQKIAIYISREKEFEYQLIEAQNHIIYLENINKQPPSITCSHQHFEIQIKNLRQTLAHYTEYIESIQKEKEDFKNTIIINEQEIHKLYQEINTLNVYISQTKTTISQNGIDPNQYYNLVTEYGKKSLQVIVLLSEIQRLQKQYVEVRSYLEKAQEYIVILQQKQNNQLVDHNSTQIELLLEEEHRKQNQMKISYEIQINRLNVIINELSHQVTIYQSEINTYKTEITNINITINSLRQQITVYQFEINQFKLEIQRITHTNIQLTQKITIYQAEITNYETKINQINHTTTIQGIDPEVYNTLVINFGKKELQVIILLQEINRLNVTKAQILQHLKKAEDYIIGAQDYIKKLEQQLNSKTNSVDVQQYKLQIKELQTKLLVLTQKITTYESSQSSHSKQMQALQLKYKELLLVSDKKYNQLLIQKNTLIQKITILTQRITNTNISIQKSLQLHQINKQLNIQIAEITQLLVNSQTYIKTNTEKWEKVQIIQRQLTEQTSVIETLNREIQLTKSQNIMLNDRIILLQRLIQEFNSTTTTTTNTSQNMTIIIREKEEVEIDGLDQQLSNLNTDFLRVKAQSQLYLKENKSLRQALENAEKHIFDLEKLINLRAQ